MGAIELSFDVGRFVKLIFWNKDVVNLVGLPFFCDRIRKT
jgi:hypothetical protein